MYPTALKKQKTKHFSRTPLPRVDRISKLPSEIVHHILTFLPNKCAARTSVLSKRFNSLWWSFSTVDFNENEHFMYALKKGYGEGPATRNMFVDHMKHCYMRHELRFVEKLKILANEPINSWEENIISSVVDSFVFSAIEGGALKELDLQFPLTEEIPFLEFDNLHEFHDSFYLLPVEVPLLACKFLHTLTLDGCSFEEFLSLDQNIELPSVRQLYIRNCLVSDNLVRELVHGCPELEYFSLTFCLRVNVLRFSHSKLKKLVIGSHETTMAFNQIDVPNLQTFKFKGAYWQYALVDPDRELRLNSARHIVNAPNLESFSVKYACVEMESIQTVLNRFKNLKEVVMNHCYMYRIPSFRGDKIESLVISNCEFILAGGLLLTDSALPVLRSLSLYSIKGIEWLSIRSTTLKELILRDFSGLDEWVISAPSVSSYRSVHLVK